MIFCHFQEELMQPTININPLENVSALYLHYKLKISCLTKVLTFSTTLFIATTTLLCATAQAAPKDWQNSVGESAVEARAQWKELTAGEDLARGKPVRFYPPPNYGLTTDENDPYDLTDGTLSSRADDRIWFNKDAVGWIQYAAKQDTGVTLAVDLGSVQPVKQIAIRVLGGREQNSLTLPDGVEFLASMDGQKYFSLENINLLGAPNDRKEHFTESYYVPQNGKAFMYPIVCRQAVRARYIIIRVTPQYSLYTDQISILKADPNTPIKNLNQYPPAQVFTDGVAVIPRQAQFVVTTNVTTPLWFFVHYFDSDKNPHSAISLHLDLPKGLELLPQPKLKPTERTILPFEETTSDVPGMHRYDFPDVRNTRLPQRNLNGPIFVRPIPGQKIPDDAKAIFTTLVDGVVSHRTQYPVQLVKVPEVPRSLGSVFDISLSWMGIEQQLRWPDYLQSTRKMGFNYHPVFPEVWHDASGYWSKPEGLKLQEQARRQGFKTVYLDSPIHVMEKTVNALRKAGKLSPEEIAEIYSQPDGKTGKYLNPLYRGKYFQEEVQRIASLTQLVKPDQVYLDIELWQRSVPDAAKDPRVIALSQKKEKTVNQVLLDAGAEILNDITKSIRSNAPNPRLPIGLFDAEASPKHPVMDSIFQWSQIYPDSVNIAQPADYVIGDVLAVADDIRDNYDALKTRQIIPWLSPGTNGEFAPSLLEPMLLETLLNGARGFTYYIYSDFDPKDFYYQAKALTALAPYEKLLKSGKPIPYAGSNPDLHYTCFASNDEALLLVGNYRGSPREDVALKLPLSSASKVLLDGTALPIKNQTVSLKVPPGEFRLVHISK